LPQLESICGPAGPLWRESCGLRSGRASIHNSMSFLPSAAGLAGCFLFGLLRRCARHELGEPNADGARSCVPRRGDAPTRGRLFFSTRSAGPTWYCGCARRGAPLNDCSRCKPCPFECFGVAGGGLRCISQIESRTSVVFRQSWCDKRCGDGAEVATAFLKPVRPACSASFPRLPDLPCPAGTKPQNKP